MSFQNLLGQARAGGEGWADDLARAALAEGEEELALPLVAREAGQRNSPRIWQWKGLLERSLDLHEQALTSFEEAAQLDPADASIAHGRARVALEAGIDSVPLFERAIRLDPQNGDMLIGLASARLASGQGDQAEAELDRKLLQAPLWVQGHRQLAQLRSLLGKSDEAAASLDRAIAQLPGNAQLWAALLDLRIARSQFAELLLAVSRARAAGLHAAALRPYEAIAAAELGKTDAADAHFTELDRSGAPPLNIWRIRHLIRSGRADEARPLIDLEIGSERAAAVWPYAEIAWRLTGDPRWDWLAGPSQFVSVIDLSSELQPLPDLAEHLRSLHVARGPYLDQSVRGGTQTDGPLFSRIDPPVRALRAAVVGAIERHVAQLPPMDGSHPLLQKRRDRRIRFSGSWSVRLQGSGYHANHVHPQGWLSSALYIALPSPGGGGNPQAGWLTLGQPTDQLGLDLPPRMQIEPREGQLVLFPSWMWHGTIPFESGERLTVAFDVAAPR